MLIDDSSLGTPSSGHFAAHNHLSADCSNAITRSGRAISLVT